MSKEGKQAYLFHSILFKLTRMPFSGITAPIVSTTSPDNLRDIIGVFSVSTVSL